MSTDKLLEINPGITSNRLFKPGDELNITILEPFVEVDVLYESKQKMTINIKKLQKMIVPYIKGTRR